MQNIKQEIKIEDLGYDDFFESKRIKLGLADFLVARVIAEHKGCYKVKDINGEYFARVSGRKMYESKSREDFPAVGDWVAVVKSDKEHAVIKAILPRRTIIRRKYNDKNDTQVVSTNIDVAFIVESIGRDYNLNRLERYFAITQDGGVKPIVVLNKIDLIPKEELNLKLSQMKTRFKDIVFVATSIVTNEGLDELKSYVKKGKTYCFLGSSGVGKSSLINKLLGKNIIKTEGIGISAGRGKHATTSREMYFMESGAIVIDNPGIREVGMVNTSEGIDILFDDIIALASGCKFVDCKHIHEPGCKVLLALKSGELDEKKYLNYISLKKEADHYEMTELEKKQKEKQFGKFIKIAKKEIKKYKN